MSDVKALKPIEAKGVDLSKFDGARVEIETTEVVTVPSRFNGNGEAEVLRVRSVPVATVKDRDGNGAEVTASELFNLSRDRDGILGWPAGPSGKLANFLRMTGASHPSELKGKKVSIRVRRKTTAEGLTREFLGFKTA